MESLSYLIKYGELTLKGRNRRLFEKKLAYRMRQKFSDYSQYELERRRSSMFLRIEGEEQKITPALGQVFGISTFSKVEFTELELDAILKKGYELTQKYIEEHPQKSYTFKVRARRSNKRFKYDTMALNRLLGEYVLESDLADRLTVDLKKADIELVVEIHDTQAYLYTAKNPGAGGLPVGISGKAGLLLSGGIDSPIAGWMMMKRGLEISPIYFHAHPFVSDRTKEKVLDLARILNRYQNWMKVYVVNFSDIQTRIKEKVSDQYVTLMTRRKMMEIASYITTKIGGKALITGENLGQVASQTPEAMRVIQDAADLPVFQPLIGLDKQEIIDMARRIGTYDTSILPYDDCCSVFASKSPNLHPSIPILRDTEDRLKMEEGWLKDVADGVEVIKL